ncbi:hypothetical protein SJI00_04155 [Pseudomonas sp. RP23018S]|uniref:hypothetical protein n=1 Tax=Pseudomonas sp. RP23018S TaxID=3096037 RepID=UPI002ACA5A8E|nr:hypothetical protein [Pseudomonas sp. RP23018S]MDZ5601973.1 hypothetical protein [Pseudomonas sp. RP23018S]
MTTELLATSADGRYQVRVSPWEAGPSHWVHSPEVIDTATGACVLQFTDPCWSVDQATWPLPNCLSLLLRKYPGQLTGSGVSVSVDCSQRVAYYGDGIAVELHALEAALEAMI